VQGTHASEDGPVSYNYVTCNLRIVAHNTVVTNDTVVSEVTISLDQAVSADDCLFTVLRSAVHRNKLPDGRIVPYENIAVLSLKLQILRYGTNHCAGKNPAVLANPGSFHDRYIGTYPGTLPYLYILMDDRKRVNFDIRCQMSIGMYIGMGVNHSMIA